MNEFELIKNYFSKISKKQSALNLKDKVEITLIKFKPILVNIKNICYKLDLYYINQ